MFLQPGKRLAGRLGRFTITTDLAGIIERKLKHASSQGQGRDCVVIVRCARSQMEMRETTVFQGSPSTGLLMGMVETWQATWTSVFI